MGSDPEQFMANLSMAIERLVIEKYKKIIQQNLN